MQLTQKNLIAGQAWEKIKAPGDPSWPGCHHSHKENLIAQLEAVINTGGASNPFEKECKKILEGLDSDAAQERAIAEKAAADLKDAAVVADDEPAITGVESPAHPKRKRSSKKPAAKPAKAAKKKK